MEKLVVRTSPEVKNVFDKYPERVKSKMLALRDIVLETAEETEGISHVEETLKWGEPS
ncbi:MAG: hypothetical protein RLP15_11455 [Cryomorphaceae bacterium]